jgi:hypothetical protein
MEENMELKQIILGVVLAVGASESVDCMQVQNSDSESASVSTSSVERPQRAAVEDAEERLTAERDCCCEDVCRGTCCCIFFSSLFAALGAGITALCFLQ